MRGSSMACSTPPLRRGEFVRCLEDAVREMNALIKRLRRRKGSHLVTGGEYG